MTLSEAVETIREYCERQDECKNCVFSDIYSNCVLEASPSYWGIPTETNLYDEEEIHKNATVQILRNSITGEESIGWWENE